MDVSLYARVSLDRQDVDLSIAAQLRALREYAEREGHVVVREFVDEAESGRTAQRPDLGHQIDNLLRRVVIAAKQDDAAGRRPPATRG